MFEWGGESGILTVDSGVLVSFRKVICTLIERITHLWMRVNLTGSFNVKSQQFLVLDIENSISHEQ